MFQDVLGYNAGLPYPFSVRSIRGMDNHRFTPPWVAIENSESYLVEDATGQRIAYVYFSDDRARRRVMDRLTRDEARRIAKAIARLPELLRHS